VREIYMKYVYGNIVLVTGASSGIGKSIAGLLMKNGFKVYGTSRNVPGGNGEIADTCDNGGFIKMINLDVCNEESVKEAISYVLDQEGRIDILINNAGFGIAGSVEDTDPSEAYSQFDTNFFGVHRMCRNIAPIMNKTIILNTFLLWKAILLVISYHIAGIRKFINFPSLLNKSAV
jgi:NAD(P)-dependent dehydrogenase (short-subunit alcohol dehydrogenase family)